ncbi:methyl-accepting chemotaxis protein [Rhizorhabdus phycosphaerae]|uniref:methyl-accepting chemotaxis protein n=1 Tax=Rhizorhabdus phycosphaerae TaxID=2711156 RepID=UPI0013EAA17D|nr:methyl-accepting chemotaxis protein [Rhizorhabdus phycosphaerae]
MKSIGRSVHMAMGAIFLVASITGLFSIWASTRGSAALEAVSNATGILRTHADADMMHDAIRSDLLSVLQADVDPSIDIDKNISDLNDHAALFLRNAEIDRQYTGDPKVAQAAVAIEADLKNYVAKAKEAAQLAKTDGVAARAQFPAFMVTFEKLETGMAGISDRIEAHVADVKAKSAAQARLAIYANIVSLVIIMILLGAITIASRRKLIAPISELAGAVQSMAKGDLAIDIPYAEREDELGMLAHATEDFRNQLKIADASKAQQAEQQAQMLVSTIGEGLARLAGGDLATPVTAHLTGPFAKLKDDFNSAQQALQQTILQVASGAGSINVGVAEIRQASTDLAHRTEMQTARIEKTAIHVAEVTQTVSETATAAAHANETVSIVRGDAERSGDVVRHAIEAMDGIARHSREISEIIGLIDGISFQTNLLALNASVEAARAGEAGKGFAVVASEVRALAQRSADAAQQVKARVTAAGDQVDVGVGLVKETGDVLERIIGRIAEIGGLVQTIASSSEAQSNQLNDINAAVSDMEKVTQQNAAMVEEANAATLSLARETDHLADLVGRFETGTPKERSVTARLAA